MGYASLSAAAACCAWAAGPAALTFTPSLTPPLTLSLYVPPYLLISSLDGSLPSHHIPSQHPSIVLPRSPLHNSRICICKIIEFLCLFISILEYTVVHPRQVPPPARPAPRALTTAARVRGGGMRGESDGESEGNVWMYRFRK